MAEQPRARRMSAMGLPSWELMQLKTFTAWANAVIGPVNRELIVSNPADDFGDGLRLVVLVEALVGESIGKYHKNPKLQPHKLENLNLPLKVVNDYCKANGIKLTYQAEDVMNGAITQIMGMLWILISKFAIDSISEDNQNAKEALLLWCQKKTAGYRGVDVKNFTTSWQDGLAFCALIHKHRPDLIDFDSLSASNAEENLNLAFEVGERDLGIPRLLDAKHLSDATQRPDEKSVMTCLSYFWKCFASMKSTEMASRRVGKLVKVERANHEVRTAFEAGARRLREYMERRSAELDAVETRRTEEDVVEHAKANAAYKKNVRKAEFAQKADLESSISYLNAKLRADRRAPYTPPPGLAMRELNAMWDDLNLKEIRHEDSITTQLRDLRGKNEALQALTGQAQNCNTWAEAVDSSILGQNTPTGFDTTLGEVEASLAKLTLYDDSYRENFKKVEGIQRHMDAVCPPGTVPEPASYAGTRDAVIGLRGVFDGIRGKLDSRRALLEAEVAKQKALNATRIDFSKKAEAFALWVADRSDELSRPIACASAADARDLQTALEKISDDVAQKYFELENLASIAQSAGGDAVPNHYSRFTVAELDAMLQGVINAADARRNALGEELSKQQGNEGLMATYTRSVEAFDAWHKPYGQKIEAAVAHDDVADSAAAAALAAERMSALDALASELEAPGKELVDAVEAANDALVEADVPVERYARRTLADVQTAFEQLGRLVSDKREVLADEIAAAEEAGMSPDELAEIAELFTTFDKDGDGTLNQKEVAALAQSLDLELTESETASLNGVDQDGLVKFLTPKLRDVATYEQVLESFQAIAEDRDFVTAQDLVKAGLDSSEVDFLEEAMAHRLDDEGRQRRSVSGAPTLDYKSYLSGVFGVIDEADEKAAAERAAAEEAERARREAEEAERARREAEEAERRRREAEEAERRRREEEERIAEEERLRAEEEARRAAEAAEAERLAEEARAAAEAAAKKAEEEAARQRALEEERQRKEEERRRAEEAERQRKEAERRAREEAERREAEEIARRKAEGMKGWLQKKGGSKGGRRNWTRRWFVLTGNGELQYFKDPGDTKEKKAIPLADCSALRMTSHKDKVFCIAFEVSETTSGKGVEKFTHILAADTRTDAEDWFEALRLWFA